MADPASLETQAIERARQQIHRLLQEVAQLSEQDVEFFEYFKQFLPRVVDALAAVGGAVWRLPCEGQLELVQQVNLASTLLDKEGEHQQHHAQLIVSTADTIEGLLVLPHAGVGEARNQGQVNKFVNAHPHYFEIQGKKFNESHLGELLGPDPLADLNILQDMEKFFLI